MDNNLQSLLAQVQQYGMSGNARPASYTDYMPGPGSGGDPQEVWRKLGELAHAFSRPAASSGAPADDQASSPGASKPIPNAPVGGQSPPSGAPTAPPGASAEPTGPIGKVASIFIPNTVRDINGMFGGTGKGGASAPAAKPGQTDSHPLVNF